MKRIANLFADKRPRSFIALLIVSILIWFAGPYIAIADNSFLANSNNRLVSILVLALLWGFNNLRLSNSQKTSKILLPPEPQILLLKSELTQLQKSFKETVAIITKLQLRHWLRRSKLPCYVVMGAEQSGKTTLLANIDQDQSTQPITSNKYCAWRLTSHAIFIDYTDAASNQSELHQTSIWQNFLKLLLNYRQRIALTGVIVTINPQQFFQQNQQQQQLQIGKICQRLQNIAEAIKTYPIYLVFTQCDLIAGFNEFFEDLSKEERDQPLGFSLSGEITNLEKTAAAQIEALIHRLHERLIWRLHQEINPIKRNRIKDFPLQLEIIKSNLLEIIKQITHTTPAQIQGVYFTSCIQQGTPTDYIIKPIATTFDLHPQLPTDSDKAAAKRYFIDALFTKIVTTPAVMPNISAQKKVYFVGYIITGVIIIGSSALWYYNYTQSLSALNAAKLAIITAQQPTKQTTQYPSLTILNALSAALEKLNNASPLKFPIMGYQQAIHLRDTANTTYQNILMKQFIPTLQKILEAKLQSSNDNPSDLYSTLKTYLMLSDPSQRDSKFVQQWFGNYWQQILPGNPTEQMQLQQHLSAALHNPALKISVNSQYVASARYALKQIPLAQLSYSVLLDHYNHKVVKLFDQQNNTLIINDHYEIPALYTTENLNEVYHEQIPLACDEVIKGNWVLGQKQQTQENNFAKNQLINQVRILYLNQYANAWAQLISKVALPNFQNLTQATILIKNLSKDDSPLFQLLNTIDINTSDDNSSAIPQFAQLVSNKFQELNNFTQTNSAYKLQTALKQLSSYLQKISNASNINKAAFTAAAERMKNNNLNDALENLSQQLASIPQILQMWIGFIPAHVWTLQLAGTQTYLNSIWANDVLTKYHSTIINRYPLFKDANTDITLNDFINFFGPDGAIASFFNNYLKPFVDTNNYYWVWKNVDNQHLDIPQSSLEMLIRAALIQRMFFANGNSAPLVKFSLIPVALEPGVNEFTLNLDGQSVIFQPAQTQTTSLRWGPNPNFVTMQFINQEGKQAILTEEGPWAWFKLLDKSSLQVTTDPRKFNVTFDLNGNSVKCELVANDLVNPFIPDLSDAFRCPEKL